MMRLNTDQQYDRKHYNPDVFEPGSIVLKKDFRRKKHAGGKQDFTWLGPYRIVKSLGRGLYRIVSVDDSSKIISRVHGVHLKQYHTPKVDSKNEIIDGDVDDQDSTEVDGDSNEATFRDSRGCDGNSREVDGDTNEASRGCDSNSREVDDDTNEAAEDVMGIVEKLMVTLMRLLLGTAEDEMEIVEKLMVTLTRLLLGTAEGQQRS
eukprot:Em0003g1597a